MLGFHGRISAAADEIRGSAGLVGEADGWQGAAGADRVVAWCGGAEGEAVAFWRHVTCEASRCSTFS